MEEIEESVISWQLREAEVSEREWPTVLGSSQVRQGLDNVGSVAQVRVILIES